MDIKIRQYQPQDYKIVVEWMNKLQDYLVAIDPLHRMRRADSYGESYTGRLLTKVKNNQGIIYLAEADKAVIGLVAGEIITQTKEDLLESVPSKNGRILELIVEDNFRGQGVGSSLMKEIEKYMISQKCEAVFIEVFGPNHLAHNFYKKFGYQDRSTNILKVLKNSPG